MPDDINQLSLLYAIVSDPEHRKRLDTLKAMQDEIDQLREVQQQEAAANQRILDETRQVRTNAEEKVAEAAEREREVAAERGRVAAVIETLNQEKARFETVRQQVDQQHNAKEAALAERENRVAAAEQGLVEKRNELNYREAALRPLEAKYRALAGHVKTLLAALGA
jgi:chromosome segregation ATPase